MTKVVLISGGNRGLGAAMVESFLRDAQYTVVTFGRTRTPFVDAMIGRPDIKGRFHFQALDITDRSSVNALLRHVLDNYGPVSILINNAALALESVLALQTDEHIDRLINTNLRGTILLTKGCTRHMLTQRWGRIVNITSIVGLGGYRGLSVYSLTKSGLDGFTRSLARELGSRQITVNSVAPGYLNTDMTQELNEEQRNQILRRTPLARFGRSQDVLPLVRFICSEEAGFITGQTIVVDGGLTV